ncbi:MAG: hypothetical protein IKK15_09510 [Akkermansia sp.]|nr:hypothetical protein [Akkermansia sp.]
MKKTLFAVILSTLPVFAQQESPMTKEIPAPAPGMEQPRHWGAAGEMPGRADRKDFHKKMLERFDADQDGQLSDAEKEAMKAEMKKNHEGKRPGHGTRGERGDRPAMPAEMMDKFDADKDGQLSDEERKNVRAAMQEKMMEKFDTDKDGQLSDAEREAAKAARPQHPRHHGKGHGKRGPKGPRGPQAPEGAANVPVTLPL